MNAPIKVQIIGAPIACKDGVKDSWREVTAWAARKVLPKFAKPADIAFFGMAFFAVSFSLYLTYLEPFVIGAVCIWCLTSAVIVTLLLLLGTPSAVLHFAISDKDE